MLLWLLDIAAQVPEYIYGPEIDSWTKEIKQQQRQNAKDFLRQLKEAGSGGQKELNLKKAHYRFSTSFSEDPSRGHIHLAGFKDFTINANGSHFWFEDYHTAIRIDQCEHVRIKNLTMDYDPLPNSQGIISGIGEDYIDFKVEEGFLSPIEIRKTITTAESKEFIYDKMTRLNKRDVPHMEGESFEEIGDNKIRMKVRIYGGLKPNTLPIQAGDYVGVVFRHRTSIVMRNSRFVSLNNVTLHSSPMFGIVTNFCDGLTFDHVKIIPRPGTKRLMSTNGDGIHVSNSGIGPRIQNCTFSAMGDDAINVRSSFDDRVHKQLSPDRALISFPSGVQLQKGDTLNLYDSETLIRKASVQIVSIAKATDPDVPERRRGTLYNIRFNNEVRLKQGDVVENLVIASRGTYIANNRFYNMTTRGIIMKAKDAIAEYNYLEDIDYAGILTFANQGSFKEGPFPENVIIRNNTLKRIGYSGTTRLPGYKKTGAICLFVEYYGPMQKGMYNVFDIRVENNYIEDTALPGIFVNHADGAVIRGNTIKKYVNGNLGRMGEHHGIKPYSAIYIADSRNVILEENHISEPGVNAEQEIKYGPCYITSEKE